MATLAKEQEPWEPHTSMLQKWHQIYVLKRSPKLWCRTPEALKTGCEAWETNSFIFMLTTLVWIEAWHILQTKHILINQDEKKLRFCTGENSGHGHRPSHAVYQRFSASFLQFLGVCGLLLSVHWHGQVCYLYTKLSINSNQIVYRSEQRLQLLS